MWVLNMKQPSGFDADVLYFEKLPYACRNLLRSCFKNAVKHGQIARNIIESLQIYRLYYCTLDCKDINIGY